MLRLLILCGIVSQVFAVFPQFLQGYNSFDDFASRPLPTFQHAGQRRRLRPSRTEFLTYVAPESDDDVVQSEVKKLADILVPQRIVFIRSPETNVFTQAAKQLARSKSLDIYVLTRTTDQAALAAQFEEIQQQHRHKPNVHFVNYRTDADLEEARRALRRQYDLLPGPSTTYHEPQRAPVIDLRSLAVASEELRVAAPPSHSPDGVLDLHALARATDEDSGPSNGDGDEAPAHEPVIFKLATRGSSSYDTYPEESKEVN